jgi:hypothetical protein
MRGLEQLQRQIDDDLFYFRLEMKIREIILFMIVLFYFYLLGLISSLWKFLSGIITSSFSIIESVLNCSESDFIKIWNMGIIPIDNLNFMFRPSFVFYFFLFFSFVSFLCVCCIFVWICYFLFVLL